MPLMLLDRVVYQFNDGQVRKGMYVGDLSVVLSQLHTVLVARGMVDGCVVL